ncbi:LOW QUALITY PROTEIN: hypothetical protein LguiB_013520 [Lonicera macranthoides]
MTDLKTSAQERLEYMLTEDDDAPLLTADDEIKLEVRESVKRLLARFNSLIETCYADPKNWISKKGKFGHFTPTSGTCRGRILAKLEKMRVVVKGWIKAPKNMVKVVEKMREKGETIKTRLKIIEVTAKVLEAVGDMTVILPTVEQICMVKVWLPFARCLKPLIDHSITNDDDEEEGGPLHKREGEYVVVRLRTPIGRDDWMYCHSQILIENSKYFADRLSDNWATCQILDSRSCVEVYCDESNFDYHVSVLRLFYVNITKCPLSELWNGVKNALCILRVAVEHGCPQIVSACVNYLESVTWEEAEEVEEEILKVILGMAPLAEPILTHLRLVLEAIGDGIVVLPTVERMCLVKVWLPFARCLKPLIDHSITNDDDGDDEEEGPLQKMEGEVWQTLESAFVSIILTLPSMEQAEILTGWLRKEYIRY